MQKLPRRNQAARVAAVFAQQGHDVGTRSPDIVERAQARDAQSGDLQDRAAHPSTEAAVLGIGLSTADKGAGTTPQGRRGRRAYLTFGLLLPAAGLAAGLLGRLNWARALSALGLPRLAARTTLTAVI